MPRYELALAGGRILDPETGRDAVGTVAIRGGRIAAVEDGAVDAARTLRVDGLVVAPGFVDLHSHAQSIAGSRLQALDGVTSALDLEAGRHPVAPALERGAGAHAVNFGYTAGWAAARAALLAGGADPDAVIPAAGGWQAPLDACGRAELIALLEADLLAGALGVGILLGYAPEVERAEVLEVAHLAARHGVPLVVHARYLSAVEPGSSLEAILELLAVAAATGAAVHVCHLHSTSVRLLEPVLDALGRARAAGLAVSAEAYPYGAGATDLGAAFLDPANLPGMGLAPQGIELVAEGRRVRDEEELRRLRRDAPQLEVITHWADERVPADRALLLRALLASDIVYASDAMNPSVDGVEVLGAEWPLPAEAVAHPRAAGTYGKVFRWLVRETVALGLLEAVRRCSLLPAEIAGLAGKGRIRPGADADLVVFDPAAFRDEARYGRLAPSVGVEHLLVGGVPVVADGVLDPGALPGRPVSRAASPR